MDGKSLSFGQGGGNNRSAVKGVTSLAVDGASMKIESTVDVHSDCDSEGNEPPAIGGFINPLAIDETTAPAKGALQDIKLPFYQAKDARRLREAFEPPISYEDWVDAEDVGGGGRKPTKGAKNEVKRLEDDSDLPTGPRYGWHAFCPPCNVSYHPLVPSQWKCIKCDGRVWQQPSDPESRHCAICSREVARNRKVFHMKVYNPLSLNPHVCKRCGRIVCDNCYSPVATDIDELGWDGPQRVCTECELDVQETRQPPPYEDLGTLHDETTVHAAVEILQTKPFWPPRCTSCNVTAVSPPRKWECYTCGGKMWQPPSAPESKTCWVCGVADPTVRCHRCGQLACAPCGAYAQPLDDMGFDTGEALPVCKCCYGGFSLSIVSEAKRSRILDEEASKRAIGGSCSKCKSASSSPKWTSSCHNQPTWQVGSTECAVCVFPLTSGSASNCRRCGRQVCVGCSQFKEPVPDKGYGPSDPQTICRVCFDPRSVYTLDHTDQTHWPPRCPVCQTTADRPPIRWRCPNECGSMWQPSDHVASRMCFCCGKKVSTPTNCRKCGRVVCGDCGAGRTELVELGFTRGMQFPTCKSCISAKNAVPEAVATSSSAMSPSGASPGQKGPPPGAFPGKKAPPPGAFPGKKGPPPGAFPGKAPPGGSPPKGPPGSNSPGKKGMPPPGAFPGKKGPPPGAFPGKKAPPPGAFPGKKGPPPGPQRAPSP